MNRRGFLLALPAVAVVAKLVAKPHPPLVVNVHGTGPMFTEDIAQRVFDSWARREGAPLTFGAAVEPFVKGPDGFLIRRAR